MSARYAGGLFSTAEDVALFCRMIMNGGDFESKRYLSEHAVAEMTRRQTAESLGASYGLGWAVGENSFGHVGACATSMGIYPKLGRITIFLVQHTSYLSG